MKREGRKTWIAAALLLPLGLVALAALVLAGRGQAAQEPAAASSESSVLVPAADFNDDGGATQDYIYDDMGGYTYPYSDTRICMQAPVYLPAGATVTEFGGYVLDDTNLARVDPVELWRVKYLEGTAFDAGSQRMASTNTTDTGKVNTVQWISDTSIDHGLVDTATYSYYAFVCIDGDHGNSLRLYAVEALYTP